MDRPTLKVTTEPAGTRLVRLTVEVPEERVQQQMQQSARELATQHPIPGFRKGRAPYHVIVQRYGEEVIRQKAADALMEPVYREALEQAGVTPYAPASLMEMVLSPVSFAFLVALPPVVDLGDYSLLRIEPPDTEPTEEEISQALEQLRQGNAVLEPVEARGAQPGDALIIAVEGRGEGGQVFLKDSQAEIVLDPQDDHPLPGFHQALEGMRPGEERVFRLKMPGGHPSEEAEFSVRLLTLSARLLPGLDDDLARTVGHFDSLEGLRRQLSEEIRQQKRRQSAEEYAQRVTDAVVEQARIEYPPGLLEEEVDQVTSQFEQQLQQERRLSMSDYLKMTGKSMEDLRGDVRPVAERRLRRALVLAEIIRAEGLKVTPEETEQYIAQLSQSWGGQAEEARKRLSTDESRQFVVSELLTRKAIDRLVAIARGDAEPAAASQEE